MTYLTTSQYKLNKSAMRGWKTVGLNLSPAAEAQAVLRRRRPVPTMCAMAGTCATVCLAKTGMNQFPTHAHVRARKTLEWVEQPATFVARVSQELQSLKATTPRLAVRPNLLSDQPKLAHRLATRHPDIQFYDYTKLPNPAQRVLPNYHLTYSVSERTTAKDLAHCLKHGINMAVVLNVERDARLPKRLKVQGQWLRVVDGDKDDLRFLDPARVVVGLRWKGSRARLQEGLAGGFVHDATQELTR